MELPYLQEQAWPLLTLVLGCWAAVSTLISVQLFILLWKPSKDPVQDYGDHRRKLAFTPPVPVPSDVVHTSQYIPNSRGALLHAQEFLPANNTKKKGGLRGVIFLCSGYADTVSWLPTERAIRFAQAGFAVYGMDYEGAGRSDGLHTEIRDFDEMVEDVYRYYVTVRKQHAGLKAFLCGESMGGAVAIKLVLRDRDRDLCDGGCILLAPMVKIADSMKPPEIVINMLRGLTVIFPSLPLVPAPPTMERAFRRPDMLAVAKQNPFAYRLRPRLATALQLLEATESVSRQMEHFDAPVLVLQGTGDTVTDPALAQEFHRRAGSKDKEIKLYEGFWHNLLSGELPHHIDQVYADIHAWLDRRVQAGDDDHHHDS